MDKLCNICHTDLDPLDDLVKLQCGHTFHYECIYITYKNNIDKSKYNTKIRVCPYCRKSSKSFDGFRKHLTRNHNTEFTINQVKKQASKLYRMYKEARV